jgi:3-hydroxybutyryl-CoA dehydrogenase
MNITKVAVLGAGTMGHGIAQVYAQSGFQVTLYDMNEDLVQSGINRIKQFLNESVERQKMTLKEADDSLGRIKTTANLKEAVKEVELVIEAVPEDMLLKKRLFQEIANTCKKETILTSNTSTLSITEIASASDRPERVAGMHFFNPVQLMKPVEIIKGVLTSDETIEVIKSVTLKLNKTPLIVKDTPGFVSTRLGVALYLEASKMLAEGVASVKDIDMTTKLGYGHRMGPFETCDLVGLDARLNNLNALYQTTGDPKWVPPLLLKQLVAAGYLGKKSGSKGGYYSYFKLAVD